MRSLFFFILIVTLLLIEIYAFQALRVVTKSKVLKFLWLALTIAVYGNFIYIILFLDRNSINNLFFQWAFGFVLTMLAFKLTIFLFLFTEDIVRVFKKVLSFFSTSQTKHLPERRKFVTQLALGLASIPLASLLYGMYKGKYNFKVIKHTLFFKDLPKSFDGYSITQISDIHSGSFDDKEKIEYAINLINKQQSDTILFTGDLVNNFANEMDNWIDVFKKLNAKDGKFSVLGNHDYGEYHNWKSNEDKQENFRKIKEIHPKIGFDLLLNEHRYIEKGNEKIAIIGVENWGRNFKKAGNLNLASKEIKKEDFKIVLSHDPTHWEEKIKNHPKNYHLTLSGHTHGMQFGIDIPGFKWSPVQYFYKHWAGIYENANKVLNVNRGFGFLAYPGRVGIWPEITVITLKRKE